MGPMCQWALSSEQLTVGRTPRGRGEALGQKLRCRLEGGGTVSVATVANLKYSITLFGGAVLGWSDWLELIYVREEYCSKRLL